jgi:hypothetical protein
VTGMMKVGMPVNELHAERKCSSVFQCRASVTEVGMVVSYPSVSAVQFWDVMNSRDNWYIP